MVGPTGRRLPPFPPFLSLTRGNDPQPFVSLALAYTHGATLWPRPAWTVRTAPPVSPRHLASPSPITHSPPTPKTTDLSPTLFSQEVDAINGYWSHRPASPSLSIMHIDRSLLERHSPQHQSPSLPVAPCFSPVAPCTPADLPVLRFVPAHRPLSKVDDNTNFLLNFQNYVWFSSWFL
jgi:hypothetical protein